MGLQGLHTDYFGPIIISLAYKAVKQGVYELAKEYIRSIQGLHLVYVEYIGVLYMGLYGVT